MTTKILIILILLYNIGYINAEVLELNSDGLTLLALKHSDDSMIADYAKYLARSKHIKTYFKYIKDKEKRNELIQGIEKTLKVDLAKIPKQAEFTFSKKIKIRNLDKDTGKFTINGFLSSSVEPFLRTSSTFKGFPEYFFLLFSNTEIVSSFELQNKKIEAYKDIKEGYIQAKLLITDYQNNQDFQVVIKEVSIYENSKKETLLVKKSEAQDFKKLTSSWLLADGYTNKLVGIHAFSVYGYRNQDMMTKMNKLKKICKKTGKIGKHNVISCSQQKTKNTQIKTKYIGGKFAQLKLVATGDLDNQEQNLIIKGLSLSLNRKPSFFKNGHQKWINHTVNLEYYSNNIMDNSANSLSTVLKNSEVDKNLIFTMMSQETIKLIEENI